MSKRRAWDFGVRAEHLAALYLMCKGYRILGTRIRAGGGEIDLLAQKNETLVGVEVKARRMLAHCEESITPDKQRRVARAMEMALAGKIAGLRVPHAPNIRFDAVFIAPFSWPRHLKDAWR